jgi:hypothetical protein
LEGVVGSELPGVGSGGVVGGNDQQILKQHELALQRLEELQGDMIGGEKGGRPSPIAARYMYMTCTCTCTLPSSPTFQCCTYLFNVVYLSA